MGKAAMSMMDKMRLAERWNMPPAALDGRVQRLTRRLGVPVEPARQGYAIVRIDDLEDIARKLNGEHR